MEGMGPTFRNRKENVPFYQRAEASASPSSLSFRLQDISVCFGQLWALREVNLSIQKGDFLFITGTSGAGKTTLLRVLARDIPPSHGHIFYGDEQQFVAKVFQDLRLIDELSCLGNLKMCYDPEIYRSRKEFDEDLKQLAKILLIDDRLGMKVKDVNGGLKQKVAILRALLSRPEAILADEPTSSLDRENAFRLFELFNFYNTKRKITIIWASHNRELIKQFNGKIIHLNRGRPIHAGNACFT
ncbi:MAG: ATP-binding cassette domain-containing protein [Bacteriovoracales bacterium]|nr:ATP-binding cassette domain-containing protein [Bacteriovoracales bacterium]